MRGQLSKVCALAVAVLAVLFSFVLGGVVLRQYIQSHPGSTGLCHKRVRFRSRNLSFS